MKEIEFVAPYSDADMIYDLEKHRYILTPDYCRNKGLDLDIILDKDLFPDPQQAVSIALDRVSMLVYTNIYNYGREKDKKEFLLACNPELRSIIRDAMFERLNYVTSAGDLSLKSGASISSGTRIETRDLVPSVVELMILRPTGILHRGEYNFILETELVY
jgi:hypothetical protein